MNIVLRKILIFCIVKFFTGVFFYFFAQYIKEGNQKFIYSFVVFYGIERIISLVIIISELKPKYYESILIIILSFFFLDEFYLLLQRKRFPLYITNGIEGQAIVITVFQIPLYIQSMIWTTFNLTIANAIFQTVVFSIISLLLLLIWLTLVFDLSIQNQKDFRFFLQSSLLTIIHFITYVWLIFMNSKYDNFGYYFMATHITLLTLFLSSIYRRLAFLRRFSNGKFIISLSFIIKEFFHIVISIGAINEKRKKETLYDFGQKIFDRMILYSFAIKLFLILMFATQFAFSEQSKNEIYFIYLFIFALSIFSVLLLGYHVLIQTILSKILGPTYLEFDNFKSLISRNQKQNQNLSEYQKRLQKIIILSDEVSAEDKLGLMESLLFCYNKSQVLNQLSKRENIITEYENQKNKGDAKFQKQIVEFNFLIDTYDIMKIIQQKKILPQIAKVQFSLNQKNNLYQLYSMLVENNMGVEFKTTYDNQELKILNQNLLSNVKQITLQFIAYNKYISKEQLANPNFIFYDLYDSLL